MKESPKNKTKGDAAYAIAKATISAIPWAGGPLTVMFENIFSAPLDKRRRLWIDKLAEVIKELQEKVGGLSQETLSRDEMFVTAVLKSSQVAQRTHEKEKIEALRNAVFNSVLPNAPDDDSQLIFLHLIDEFTAWHMRLLAFFDDPNKWMTSNKAPDFGLVIGGIDKLIEHCFPELRGKLDFYRQLIRDLQSAGLLVQDQLIGLTMGRDSMSESRTTSMGKRFLAYISREA